MSPFHHITVLENPLIDLSSATPSLDLAIDCTAGGGGHTAKLLEKFKKVVSIDQDLQAIQHLQERFAAELLQNKLTLACQRFSEIKQLAETLGISGQIDCIVADLGVSSPQIDQDDRGFSFNHDGPLDMRMNRNQELTAAGIIHSYSEEQLQYLFWTYGEEPASKRYARLICERRQLRPFQTTLDLAEFIKSKNPYMKPSRKHPATKIFQSLRIEVNQELKELEVLLNDGFEILKPGGRLGIITFHSLEDRMVKRYFIKLAKSANPLPKDLPITAQEILDKEPPPLGTIIKPFPFIPPDSETTSNPRARSAKLRVIEKREHSAS